MANRAAGQTINDRFLAARHSIAGSGLAKAVCKATTEEMIGPKKKHLDYLMHCTNEPNVSIPQLANLLIERSQNANWVVVYKALVTCHHLMCYGNERFTQYLASSNSTFQLNNFLDKGGLQGYDMSPFVRRYSRYLNEKALSYRSVAFDFCKVKRGKEDGMLRTMSPDKLLKTIPVLQSQLGALLEFDCGANDLTNGIINMCFMLLFRDLIRLFTCYNDAIINLLEKYFDMNKKQCKEALDIYKKFLIKMDSVSEFLKVAENVGIDKGDIPDLTKAPNSLLDALEQHYNYLEGRKQNSSSGGNNPPPSTNQKNVKSGVSALNTTSNAFGTIASSGRLDGIDESLKMKVLAEEEAAMNQFKSKLPATVQTNNPFLSESDMFSEQATSSKASDDLLQLQNPFIVEQQQPTQPKYWTANSGVQFVSDNNFLSVFGHQEPTSSSFDALGGVLQPITNGNNTTTPSMITNNHIDSTTANGNNNVNNNSNNNGGLLTGDLESSLASLAENLTISDRKQTIKGVQWNSPKTSSKPLNWSPQPMSATTGANYKPMNQQLNNVPFTPTFPQAPMMGQSIYPQIGMLAKPQPNSLGNQQLLFH